MKKSTLQLISNFCLLFGFLSIMGSIIMWYFLGGNMSVDWHDAALCAQRAYGERFGIFIGLWAPTFFILSNRFSYYADRLGREE
ncbi:MAG: hypothetical protein A3F67_03475 [Verrucomicrobia bacterium RIFCSPHIGHO2_12_FULL_41_10]|nr:MAG: hypothetical protein A3F67_03475 [Verrucomicrobia bacterium RIFCSPHIGHO2_12_FULL_41_10]HLB34869.1 hypothetical protein [Chthoniobacterales bacterium]